MTITNDRSYIDACAKLNALEEFGKKVAALQDEIRGLVTRGFLDEGNGAIAVESLGDWRSDREGDWDLEDLRDEVMAYAGKYPDAA